MPLQYTPPRDITHAHCDAPHALLVNFLLATPDNGIQENLLQFAVCVITSKITKLIIVLLCNSMFQAKQIQINDNVKQIDVSRLVNMYTAISDSRRS